MKFQRWTESRLEDIAGQIASDNQMQAGEKTLAVWPVNIRITYLPRGAQWYTKSVRVDTLLAQTDFVQSGF
jgi:hypothetical protein